MKTKTFDCVEMKRQGAEKVQQELAGMTREEEIAFWQSGTEELRQRQRQARAVGENRDHAPAGRRNAEEKAPQPPIMGESERAMP